MDDMLRKGRSLKGEKNPKAIVTEKMVREIRRIYSNGQKIKDIRALLGLGRGIVSPIVHRINWKHVI